MISGAQTKVCFASHGELEDGLKGSKSRHKPVEGGDCTKCHNPHRAKLGKLLLVQGPDLCLQCHTDLKGKMTGTNVHPPAARDCLRCHVPHFSKEASLEAEPLPRLCLSCHDGKKASFSKAHLAIDPNEMHCTTCHAPHASKDPKLFQENVHAPFADRSCGECHLTD
jgi:predicted CXXCH cytochrome family protein